jgi:hypothetical protein
MMAVQAYQNSMRQNIYQNQNPQQGSNDVTWKTSLLNERGNEIIIETNDENKPINRNVLVQDNKTKILNSSSLFNFVTTNGSIDVPALASTNSQSKHLKQQQQQQLQQPSQEPPHLYQNKQQSQSEIESTKQMPAIDNNSYLHGSMAFMSHSSISNHHHLLQVVDTDPVMIVSESMCFKLVEGRVTCIVVTKDGSFVIAGFANGCVRIFDMSLDGGGDEEDRCGHVLTRIESNTFQTTLLLHLELYEQPVSSITINNKSGHSPIPCCHLFAGNLI